MKGRLMHIYVLKNTALLNGVYIFIFLLTTLSLFSLESELDISVHLSEDVLLQWETSSLAAEIYPNYTEDEANYSFPSPVRLTCCSNSLRGWKVIAESENLALDNTFLLVSEDQKYSIRYVLVIENENKQLISIKNGETMIHTSEFLSKTAQVDVYPTILGGEINKSPQGYYIGKIKACFISN